MSKAVLILDRPICCELCYLNRQREKGRYCVITNTYDKNYGNVKEDCPLKPLPQEKVIISIPEKASPIEFNGHICYAKGWNDCIDKLLGEDK